MKPYSEDLRKAAVRAYLKGKGSYAKIADIFDIHWKTLQDWVKLEKEGTPQKPRGKGRRPRALSKADCEKIARMLDERPSATLEELRKSIGVETQISVYWRAVKELGYAFRLHSAGKALEAEALLELLDENMSYSEQEELRIEKIHDECSNLVQTRLKNNFTGNPDTNESYKSEPITALEVFYGKDNEIAPDSFRGQNFILTHIDEQKGLNQICGSEFWGKWLDTIREELSTARSKELAFLLDCLDDQKDVIRKSSEDAWLQVMENIREEIDKLAKPVARAKEAEDDASTIKKQLLMLRLDAFAKYGVQTSLLELESPETLEYVLLLLNLVSSREYDLIIEMGEGADTALL